MIKKTGEKHLNYISFDTISNKLSFDEYYD